MTLLGHLVQDAPLRGDGAQLRAEVFELLSMPHPLADSAKSSEILRGRVVQGLLGQGDVLLEAEVLAVIPRIQHLVQLDVDRIADAVGDDVDEWPGPPCEAPTLRTIEVYSPALIARAEGDDEDLVAGRAIACLDPGAEGRGVRGTAAADQT